MNVRVIGAGNAWRGDDGAGPAVVDRIRAAVPGADVAAWEGEPVGMLDLFEGTDAVILIDAVSSGAPAGTVHRFDAGAGPVPAPFRARGTHALSVAEAVELARTLGRLPARLLLIGIEGASFDAGSALSHDVERAVSDVADAIACRLARSEI